MSLLISRSSRKSRGLKFSDRVRKMKTGARRESWSEEKNDDELLATTFQLLNGTEMGSF